jgi:8-oxo-dGTP diphosphatase
MKYSYPYPRPALAVDAVVFGFADEDVCGLFIERALEPFKGRWALPGGFVRPGETPEAAARRELGEEGGIQQEIYLEQLYTFGDPERHPGDWVVSVAYYALVRKDRFNVKPGSDAKDAQWFSLKKRPALAFDHGRIVDTALQRLRSKVHYQPIGFELLPEQFTYAELQQLYEVILGEALDKRNFRKKFDSLGILREVGVVPTGKRPATTYEFDRKKYQQMQRRGFHFEV